MDETFKFLVAEVPSYFSHIYYGTDAIETALNRCNIEYIKKESSLLIKDKKIICKEIYVDGSKFNQLPKNEMEYIMLLVCEVYANSLNELFLYHNGVISVKKRIAKKIGKLEKLALATQKELDYKWQILFSEKQMFDEKIKKFQEEIMETGIKDPLSVIFKQISLMLEAIIYNIKVRVVSLLIKEMMGYLREATKLKLNFNPTTIIAGNIPNFK